MASDNVQDSQGKLKDQVTKTTRMPLHPTPAPYSRLIRPVPELMVGICKLLPKEDLKSLRLASPEFSEYVLPILYRTIYLSGHPRHLEGAELICRNFGRYVKVLYISPCVFMDLKRGYYGWEAGERLDGIHAHRTSQFAKHVQKGWIYYSSLSTTAEWNLWPGKIDETLSQALSLAPGIQRIVFTDADRERKEFTAAEAKAVCPSPRHCDLAQDSHKAFHMPRNKLWEDFPTLIDSVFRVISESSIAIKELAVERLEPARRSTDRHEMGFFSSTFVNRTSTETGYLGNVFANLTKLRFILTKQLVGRRWRKKPIAGLLAQARNLEELFLERGRHTSMDLQGTATLPIISGFQGLLEKCSFPMPKSLYLNNVNARAKEIKRFLELTEKLQNLIIAECRLHEGSWESVADQIKDHRYIDEAHLDRLCGGFQGFEELQWMDKYCGFEDFFYSSAPNPFSYAQLKIYEQDIEDQREALKNHLSGNSDYYYGRWFDTEALPWKGFQETLSHIPQPL